MEELSAYKKYLNWLDRATLFYIGSRSLHFNELLSPSAFCGFQSLENMLKALLVYHIENFDPEDMGHKIEQLIKKVEETVSNAKGKIDIPSYFYFQKRYQLNTRYPNPSKMIRHPGSYLYDLDMAFYNLLILGPRPSRSQIGKIIKKKDKHYDLLFKDNEFAEKMIEFITID